MRLFAQRQIVGHLDGFGLHPDVAAAGDGVAGVEEQVQEHLLHLVGAVARHPERPVVEGPFEFNGSGDGMARERDHGVDRLMERRTPASDALAPGGRSRAACGSDGPRGGLDHALVALSGDSGGTRIQHERRVAGDALQDIVEVGRCCRGQEVDGFELLVVTTCSRRLLGLRRGPPGWPWTPAGRRRCPPSSGSGRIRWMRAIAATNRAPRTGQDAPRVAQASRFRCRTGCHRQHEPGDFRAAEDVVRRISAAR